MRRYLTFILLLLWSQVGLGQLDSSTVANKPIIVKGEIHLTAKYYGDSTVLRWGYDQPDLWFHNIKKPVTVWRRDVTAGLQQYELLTEIIPWSEAEMERKAALMKDPEMTVVVLQNVHREWENTYAEGGKDLIQKWDNFHNRWSLVHYAADVDPVAANAAGLRYVDNNVEPGHTYAYKVMSTEFLRLKMDYKVVPPLVRNYTPKLYGAASLESGVHLHWEREWNEKHFTAYYIEKSQDSLNWTRLNEVPFVQMFADDLKAGDFFTYRDSVDNDIDHYYRIRGIDAFGDISQPSNVIIGRGKDKTPPPAPVLKADTSVAHLTKVLNWTQENPDDVVAYHLERTFGDASYVHRHWAEPGMTSQMDKTLVEGIYGYRLIAEDTNGNISYSNQIFTKVHDTEPPLKPTGLSASTDTSGQIVLTWDKPLERDVIGYFIYAGDGQKRHLTKLNEQVHRARLYIDQVNPYLLTEKRYYTLVAIDNDYLLSDFSDTLVIDRPDAVPPAPALIASYEVKQGTVNFILMPSSSRDVSRHLLRRSEVGTGVWEDIHFFTTSHKSYSDLSGEPGKTYYYQYLAEDISGNRSKSVKDLSITWMAAEIPAPELSVVEKDKVVEVTWQSEKNESQVILYRKINDGPAITLKKMSTDTASFTDTRIEEGQSYTYLARIVLPDGSQSPFSEPVKIEL